MTAPKDRSYELPALPAEREGPVFEEPWQATAFALAVHLSERGAMPWSEWTAALGQEIQAAVGDAPQVDRYFEHWLRALERICAEKDMVDLAEVRTRQEAWRRAYLNTPHGEPVELAAAPRSPLR
jgi:nitrile hydratase accessory protein